MNLKKLFFGTPDAQVAIAERRFFDEISQELEEFLDFIRPQFRFCFGEEIAGINEGAVL